MRSMTITAASAALALSMTLAAQAQSPQPQAQPQGQQSGTPVVRSVNIVDVSELPPETKSQVDAAASKASKADLERLRTSIDKSPEITKALGDKGAKSSDVIVANLDQQGVLTLVTKKRA